LESEKEDDNKSVEEEKLIDEIETEASSETSEDIEIEGDEEEKQEETEKQETEKQETEKQETEKDEEPEEDEELFEIEIDDVTYCTNNDENGFIYELTEEGDVGAKVGYLKDSEPFFYADEK
jgi:hypothetical protein